jgi:putative ABC transport system ATP-binding protein
MSLELRHVKKSYREPDGRRLPVLEIEEFDIAAGEQVALVGASGGGKTTLLNVIAGITAPDSGEIRVGGVEISARPEAWRDRFRAERIGYVFQTFHLLPAFTALENVLLGMSFRGKGADRRQAMRLLERVGVGHRMHHRPPQLSVGEQQRVSVARALANTPQLLLADEPTANVDPANQQNILDLLRDSCREHNVSLLLVTHAADVAQQFDRVDRLSKFNGVTASGNRKAEG